MSPLHGSELKMCTFNKHWCRFIEQSLSHVMRVQSKPYTNNVGNGQPMKDPPPRIDRTPRTKCSSVKENERKSTQEGLLCISQLYKEYNELKHQELSPSTHILPTQWYFTWTWGKLSQGILRTAYTFQILPHAWAQMEIQISLGWRLRRWNLSEVLVSHNNTTAPNYLNRP